MRDRLCARPEHHRLTGVSRTSLDIRCQHCPLVVTELVMMQFRTADEAIRQAERDWAIRELES